MGSWADHAIAKLQAGERAVIHPTGNSMRPLVHSGDEVVLEPIHDPGVLAKGDIVLVKVKGSVYLHLVSAADNDRLQISNNHGRVNGWVPRSKPWGIAVSIRRR